jgi:hypothetical protein
MSERRFPPPWFIEDIGGCFVFKASNNQPLVFINTGKVPPADPSQNY